MFSQRILSVSEGVLLVGPIKPVYNIVIDSWINILGHVHTDAFLFECVFDRCKNASIDLRPH